jgi:phospholipid/cholesterol/gamma-HCH transport system permease protein
MTMVTRLSEMVGAEFIAVLEDLGTATEMVKASFRWLLRGKVEVRQTLVQALRIGVDSLPVTALTSFFTGMVLALQSGTTSQYIFNEPLYVGTVVGFSVIMELGPVLTAIVVSGRAGAAIAAEIGTMKVTEQIDALTTLGTDPVRYLVIPRYIALIITLPLLTVFSSVTGIFGGFAVSAAKLNIPSTVYYDDIFTFMKIHHYMHGFLKSFVFAFVIATVCCHRGLQTRGGAEGVGRSTTSAVVISMVSILLLDYFVTAVLVACGI